GTSCSKPACCSRGRFKGWANRSLKAWPPPYEALVGDLSGAYSRRINIQPRLIYQVLDNERREYSSSLPG
ncbi:type II toxin-antitoxin system YoeB family toxin, partial [Cyanobium sp. BA20m-14]|nr:type II toxin-antitoxin system YoeB family toxin [Cyanobium sp. BA20m-14]